MAASAAPGPKIGKYEVLEVIGEGGMGIVYKGIDPRIGRLVAIKKMTARFSEDSGILQRFYREAQAAGTLQHPNIVTIYELGEEDGSPYLVMEYLNGQSLEKLIESRATLPLSYKLDIIQQICSALHYAHQQGVVHRDIKPANVMVVNNGRVKICDFGIAHTMDKGLTRTGQIIGTLNYISPEQLNGAQVDGRADIFATGTMMFQLLTGHLPFDAPETAAIITRILHQPVPSLSLYLKGYPEELDNLLQKATAKDVNQRFRTADDLGLELVRIKERLDHEAIDECLDEARAKIVASDLTGARDMLSKVLKLDSRNIAANEAMANVQRMLEQNENRVKIQQLRTQAQEAFSSKKYPEALDKINAAILIAQTDPDLLSFREAIQQSMGRKDQAAKLQQLAEAASSAGQYEIAKKVIEDALQADPNNTQAQMFHASVVEKLAIETKQREVRDLLDNARQNIASRHFTAAHDMIRKAEAIDPQHSDLAAVKEVARTGAEQEVRQREIEQACNEVQAYLDASDYDSACQQAEKALKRFPSDPTLVKQKAQAESMQLLERRDRQVMAYLVEIEELLKSGKHKDALDVASKAAHKFPTDPRLQSALEQSRKELGERVGNNITVGFTPYSFGLPLDPAKLQDLNHNATMDVVAARPATHPDISNQKTEVPTTPPGVMPAVEVKPAVDAPKPESKEAPKAAPKPSASKVVVPEKKKKSKTPPAQNNDNVAAMPALMSPTPAQAPAAKPAAAAIAKKPANTKLIIAAVAALALVLVVVGAVKILSRPKTPAPVANIPVSINAVPWATVVELVPPNGQPIKINELTPALISVPAGDYTVRMIGPNGTEHQEQIHVNGNSGNYSHEFEAVDVEKLVNSYR